jgi:hypothetical protein
MRCVPRLLVSFLPVPMYWFQDPCCIFLRIPRGRRSGKPLNIRLGRTIRLRSDVWCEGFHGYLLELVDSSILIKF